MNKKHVLIIFGGKSGEHEVSVRSARSIEENIDRDRFTTHVLGVTQDGRWNYGETIAEITDEKRVLQPSMQILLPSENEGATFSIITNTGLEKLSFDVIFPIIHGTNGEDGTLQGVLELSNLPYVGSNVLGSAIAMDKVIQKMICRYEGIPQTKFVWFRKEEWGKNPTTCIKEITQELTFPIFVKPANLGSSVGISKVKQAAELHHAITTAFLYDSKIIIEQGVEHIKEIEVAVLGNSQPEASVCGAIIPRSEFYDYETKYMTDDIEVEIPAHIPADVAEKIRKAAIQTFTCLNCSGMSRVDFFYQTETKQYFLNEINTLPGFTSISMYPKLWQATGLSYTDLTSRLLELAIEKWRDKQKLKYTY